MNEFWIWFSTGVEHILDIDGYDHILFVSLLALTFPFQYWKKLLILVTAFTVGHSLSLAYNVFRGIFIDQIVIELLIALSILVSAIYNMIYYKKESNTTPIVIYSLVLFFGLMHGLGFSYLLKTMLGREENVVLPLLYFNLGIELGQIIIIIIAIGFSLLLTHFLKWSFTIYKLTLVCLISLIALKMSAERFWELFASS